MARTCDTCTHPKRLDIERQLVAGKSPLRIAAEFKLSRNSIQRHWWEGHVSERIAKAQGVREALAADDLLAQARTLQEQAFGILADATARTEVPDGKGGKRPGPVTDPKLALRALHQCRENVRLLGEVLGKLKPQGAAGGVSSVSVIIYELPDNGRGTIPNQPENGNGKRDRYGGVKR